MVIWSVHVNIIYCVSIFPDIDDLLFISKSTPTEVFSKVGFLKSEYIVIQNKNINGFSLHVVFN